MSILLTKWPESIQRKFHPVAGHFRCYTIYNDVLDLAKINGYIVNKEVTAKKYIEVNIF